MLKRPKKIEKVQISQTSFFKAKRKISPVKTFTKTPSPESIIRVNNKLELLTSFKTSFQSQRSINRNLTPIPRTLANIPNIDLTTLDIKNYGLGDNQAKVLSSAIKSMNRLEKINLRGNGIKDSGTFSILNSLNRSHIRVLDVSNNSLGTRAIETLSEIINDESAVIEEINLENSKISQSGLSKLCRSLMHNKTVKVLNLANNHIGVGSGTHLGDMLDYNSYLESLDLQWNFIRASEAILFFQSLKNNNSVKVLDLSWNSLGQDKISQSISVISESLRFNDTLQHIDLSNNTFSYEDCIEISKRLQNNHSIKGLHIEGNHGKIDSLGFLIPIHRIITPISSKKAKKITTKPLSKSSEHCWICNNWADVVIEWDPSRVVWNRRLKHFAMDKLSTQVEPVFVHLEIDEFTPFLLNRNEENVYFCIRALPPGKFRFFFTYRGVAQISNQYSVEAAGEKIEKVMHFYGDFSKTIMAVVVNFSDNANTELNSVPRPEIYEYTPLPGDVPEPDIPPWQLENSIFAGFIQDSPELLSKCFEADWSNSKLTKLFKSDVNKFTCKEMIKEEYAKIYYTYKYLAAINSNSNVFSVNLNTLTDLYQKQGVFDRNFKVSDLDLNIKACTFGSISSHTNSTFSVFRHEFLELQIRVSMDKYLRTGVLKSEPEALKGFFDKNWCLDINPCEWRVKRLYNEECDMVLTGFKESLLVLYENTKQKRFKNIEKKGVVEEDFIIMMQEHGFFNEKFTNRYGSICFHLALISRVDEVNSSTHMQANFVEFLEAFCRVVDLSDSKDPEKNIFKGYTDENYSLDHKLESALLNFAYLKPRKNRRN